MNNVYDNGFCLTNKLNQSICHCCEEYYESYFEITSKNNNNSDCIFEYVLFDCEFCAPICQKKHFTSSICKINNELKAVCHCCNNKELITTQMPLTVLTIQPKKL